MYMHTWFGLRVREGEASKILLSRFSREVVIVTGNMASFSSHGLIMWTYWERSTYVAEHDQGQSSAWG